MAAALLPSRGHPGLHAAPCAAGLRVPWRHALRASTRQAKFGGVCTAHAEAAEALAQLAAHLPMAAEPVALPCSLMNCGDVIYRRYPTPSAPTRKCAPRAAFALPLARNHLLCMFASTRSTLDPVLRGEVEAVPGWRALLLLATAATYFLVPPGTQFPLLWLLGVLPLLFAAGPVVH